MTDLGYTPARATRRAYEPDTELGDMISFCGADGFSVRGIPVPAEPLAADRKYGLEPAVDRERYTRTPGVRLRGTTPDPLDHGAKPGRGADILYEGKVFPVVSNFTDEQRREAYDRLLAEALALPGVVLYDGPNGRLARHGNKHVMTRVCRSCGTEYSKWRYATQTGKWGWNCSEECRKEYKRRADRERMRRKRASRVSCCR